MTHYWRAVPIVGALLLAACGRESRMDPQLKADLDAASAATIEFAPAGTGTKVVSGIEQVNRTKAVTTTAKPRTTVETTRPQSPEASAAASKEPAASVPTSRPAVQPPPPGGYKTVDEVIRKAPFPIKPVHENRDRRPKT